MCLFKTFKIYSKDIAMADNQVGNINGLNLQVLRELASQVSNSKAQNFDLKIASQQLQQAPQTPSQNMQASQQIPSHIAQVPPVASSQISQMPQTQLIQNVQNPQVQNTNGYIIAGFQIPTQTIYLVIVVSLIAIIIWYYSKPKYKKDKDKKNNESE